MPLEIDYYNLSIHKLMLQDQVRCEAFSKAIAETITPDCAVLDIGAGTGILSLFAAQAGARIVYAVERTDIAELARRIVLENSFENKIKIFQNDMENVELPEKVDVIVSEWLGGYGIDENLLPIIIQAKDRWLKSGGKMIPSEVTSWVAPAYDGLLLQDVVFWCNKPYGLNMTAIIKDTYRQLHCCMNHIKKEQILCSPQKKIQTTIITKIITYILTFIIMSLSGLVSFPATCTRHSMSCAFSFLQINLRSAFVLSFYLEPLYRPYIASNSQSHYSLSAQRS